MANDEPAEVRLPATPFIVNSANHCPLRRRFFSLKNMHLRPPANRMVQLFYRL